MAKVYLELGQCLLLARQALRVSTCCFLRTAAAAANREFSRQVSLARFLFDRFISIAAGSQAQ
jgi:hypothetical protein